MGTKKAAADLEVRAPAPVNARADQREAGAEQWRLFVALPLPEDSQRELLAEVSRLGERISLVLRREPHLHLTLVFLGNVAAPRVPELIASIPTALEGVRPLQLRAEGLGTFGGRVLWVGLRGDDQRLEELAIRLRAATRRFAERCDDRPFLPHITLARRGAWERASRFAGPEFERLLAEHQHTVFAQWLADRVILFRSELQPKGARYTALAEFPLSPATPSGC